MTTFPVVSYRSGMTKNPVISLLLLTLAVAGCQRASAPVKPTAEEAEAAIRAHLARRGDLALDEMEIEIGEMKLEGDVVLAPVVFRTTVGTADGQGEMPFTYRLRRESGGWVVEAPVAPESHEALPPGHPETGGEAVTEKKDPATAH